MIFWKDLYFRCPCCRKPLAVERAAAGGKAPCPGCKASISIPRRSGIPPKLMRRACVVVLNVGAVAALSFAGVEYFKRQAAPVAAEEPVRRLSPLEKALAEKRRAPPPGLAATGEKFNATAMDEMRAKSIALAEKNAKLQTQFEGMAKWVLENYEGKYPLPLNLVSNLNLAPVSSNFTIGVEVASFLKVTPDEQVLVNDALLHARAQVAKTEASIASVTEKAADSVKLYVPPYAKQGETVKGDLFASLEKTLGGPRADKFSDVTRQGLNEAYHHFGTAAREMQFQVVPAQGSDPAYLLITDGWQIPDGDSVTRYSSKQTAVMEIPGEYANFLNLLPPGFAAFPLQQPL